MSFLLPALAANLFVVGLFFVFYYFVSWLPYWGLPFAITAFFGMVLVGGGLEDWLEEHNR